MPTVPQSLLPDRHTVMPPSSSFCWKRLKNTPKGNQLSEEEKTVRASYNRILYIHIYCGFFRPGRLFLMVNILHNFNLTFSVKLLFVWMSVSSAQTMVKKQNKKIFGSILCEKFHS